MRKPTLWLRLAAIIMLLQATGHTLGGVIFYRAHTPAEAAVMQAMQSSEVHVAGVTRSLWEFYYGWGLAVGALAYVLAGLAWVTGGLVQRVPIGLDPLFFLLIAGSLSQTALSLRYFFALPAGLTAAAALACAIGWMLYRKRD